MYLCLIDIVGRPMSQWLTYLLMNIKVRSPMEFSRLVLMCDQLSYLFIFLSLPWSWRWFLAIPRYLFYSLFKREVKIYLHESGWVNLKLYYLEIATGKLMKFFNVISLIRPASLLLGLVTTGFSFSMWYTILNWFLFTNKDLSRMSLTMLLHEFTRKLRVTFLSSAPFPSTAPD